METKRHLNRQGTKVLHDIVNAYETGILDDPQSAASFCGLLALICEGKVKGLFDEQSGNIQWSLTKEYLEEIEKTRNEVLQSGIITGKIVKGPWTG